MFDANEPENQIKVAPNFSKTLKCTTLSTGDAGYYSDLEMVCVFEQASGKNIPFDIVARRAGDLAEYYADPALAQQLLGWQAQLDIDAMCADTWRWQINHPNGYR